MMIILLCTHLYYCSIQQ